MQVVRRGALLLVAMVVSLAVVASPAGAISRIGPDRNDYGAISGDTYSYVLINSVEGSIPSIRLPLYFKNNTADKVVTITGADLCGVSDRDFNNNNNQATGDAASVGPPSYKYKTGTRITSFTYVGQATTPTYGVVSTSGSCYTATKTLTIPKGKLVFDSDSGYYRVMFNAAIYLNRYVQNRFRISIEPGAIVGYSASYGANSFGIARDHLQSGFRQYAIPFAAPCSTPANDLATISIYDDDNQDGVIQGGDPFYIEVNQYKKSGAYEGKVAFTSWNKMTKLSSTRLEPKSGNKGTATATFKAQPDKNYRFIVHSVFWINVLQFRLPYDSINYLLPCSNWNLSGTSTSSATTITPGATATWSHVIKNDGPDSTSSGVTASVYQTINGGAPTKVGGDTTIAAGLAKNASAPSIPSSYTASAADIGKTICHYASWTPDTGAGGDTDTSEPACVIVAKRPVVSIWGNDVRVGSSLLPGGAQPSQILGSVLLGTDGKYHGTWGEYGVVAPGVITNFASGSGLAVGNASAAQLAWSKLTFANKLGTGNFAPASSLGVLPDVGTYFAGVSDPAITKVSGGNMNIGSYAANTVYLSTGKVRITGDIIGQANAPDDSSIEQMVIIAANGIEISENVNRIDAWLVTPNGVVDTCYQKSGNLTTNDCKTALTITGPVIASKLNLKRTAGDESNPAEQINLRGDSYIWAYKRSYASGTYQTRHTTELPPRY